MVLGQREEVIYWLESTNDWNDLMTNDLYANEYNAMYIERIASR